MAAFNTSPIMQRVIDQTLPSFEGGTLSHEQIRSINDAETIQTAVGGEAIFRMMNEAISYAQSEVLIQTFAYENDIPAVIELKQKLVQIASRKEEELRIHGEVQPLRLYLLIDERGPVAHFAFTGKWPRQWPLDPESVGLIHRPGLVEVYVDTHYHHSMGGNHAKTVVIDAHTLMITGANFQASNYGHVPAHDAGWLIKGDVARSAREDFAAMWAMRKNVLITPDLTMDIPPFVGEPISKPATILFTTQNKKRLRSVEILSNPQNCAFSSALKAAERIVRIATPNLNAPFIMDALLEFINERGGHVQLLLGKSFNDSREATAFMGGSNQATVDTLFRKIRPGSEDQLDIRWFSLNGRDPVRGNVAGACHLKFMNIDDQLSIVGNANLDVISTVHNHEANLVIDHAEATRRITSIVFEEVFARGIRARPSEGFKEFILESVGYRGWQEVLGARYAITIQEVTRERQGYRTLKLVKPVSFDFLPGQYLEVRSGGIMSKTANKNPAVLAIASGIHDEVLEITARGSRLHWHPNHCLSRNAGEGIEIRGPIGTSFPMELLSPDRPLFLLGGGSGLTVIRSLYKSCPEGINPIILYSAQTEDSLFYRNEIDEWKEQGHYISLTRETREGFENRRITDQLQTMEIPPESLAFVCGPTRLIEGAVQALLNKGLPLTQIYVSLPVCAKQGGPVYRADAPIVRRRMRISELSSVSNA